MSRDGNIAVNWMDCNDQLVELEFAADRVRYFFESSGEESSVARTDIGKSELYKALSSSHA